MKETLDRLYYVLTGSRLTDWIAKNDNFVYHTVPSGQTLAGLNTIPGIDRIREQLPDAAYPYLMIDLVSEQADPTRSGLKQVTLSIDLAIFEPGRSFASIFGFKTRRGIVDLARDVRAHLKNHETLKDVNDDVWAFACRFGATQYQTGASDKGIPNGKRYASLMVTYWVANENERT